MFPCTVTITINNADELLNLAGITGAAVAAKQEVAEAPAKKSAKPAASPAPTSPTATGAVADAPVKTASEPAQPAASAETAQPASTAVTEAPKVAYADLQKAVMKLHSLDPKAPVPIANSLGAATFKVLPEDKWAEALKLVQEAIAAKEVA